MGLFSCFSAEGAAPPPDFPNKSPAPLAPDPASSPKAANRRVQALLEEAHAEIQRLNSRLQQQSATVAQRTEDSSRDLARTDNSGHRVEELTTQLSGANAELTKATNKVQELESEVKSLRSTLSDTERARATAEQAQQQARTELQATQDELRAVQQQAASSAAAIDDLYLQTSSFLAQQGVAVGPHHQQGMQQQQQQQQQQPSGRVPNQGARRADLGPLPELLTPDLAAPGPARIMRSVEVPAVAARAPAGAVVGSTVELQQNIQGLVGQQQTLESRCQALSRQVEVLQLERTSVQQAYEQAFDQGQALREDVLRLESELSELQAAGVKTGAQEEAQAEAREHLTRLEGRVKELTEENAGLIEALRVAREAADAAAAQASQDHTALLAAQEALDLRHTQAAGARAVEAEVQGAALKAAEERALRAEESAAQAALEVEQMRREVASHSFTAEGTAGQVDALLREITTLKKRYATLEADMRMKDEMMGLLQTELAEVADVDLDGALVSAAMARPPPLAPARPPSNSHAVVKT